jgi:CD109 antigen
LTAIGQKNLEFYGEKKLTYLEKRFSIFIQTDKAIYKADDVIHFRVFAINPNSSPYSVKGNPEVTIKDPSGNKIKQMTNVTFVKGKYESELLLSSSPPLGSWSIIADVEGEVNRVEIKNQIIFLFFSIGHNKVD